MVVDSIPMDRREFLATALALGASVLDAGETGGFKKILEMMKEKTRQELLLLLDDDVYNVREAATTELRSRAIAEIRQQNTTLSWKNELKPQKASTEVRKRLQMILSDVYLEEAKILWSGKRMPHIAGYKDGEEVTMKTYAAALNSKIGGFLDTNKVGEYRTFKREEDMPKVLPAREGELFWEWVERNPALMSVSAEEARLELRDQAEGKHMAHDGAFFGKMDFSGRTGMVYCMTDPGIELLDVMPDSVSITMYGKTGRLPADPTASCSNGVFFQLPPGTDAKNIDALSVNVLTDCVPVLQKSVTDFSKETTHSMGLYTIRLMPMREDVATTGDKCYLVTCEITMTKNSLGSSEPIENMPKRFFTGYEEPTPGKPSVALSCIAAFDHLEGGARFVLSFLHRPTQLDIRIPDEENRHFMERTLKFDLRKK